MVEEATAFTGDSLLSKPLPEQKDAESSEIEAVPKVYSFYLSGRPWGLTKLPRTATFIIPHPFFPPRLLPYSPVDVFLSSHIR